MYKFVVLAGIVLILAPWVDSVVAQVNCNHRDRADDASCPLGSCVKEGSNCVKNLDDVKYPQCGQQVPELQKFCVYTAVPGGPRCTRKVCPAWDDGTCYSISAGSACDRPECGTPQEYGNILPGINYGDC